MTDNAADHFEKTNLLSWNLFLNGNWDAYTAIYNGYFKILCNYGCRFSKDKSLIEDCIHDLFVRLWTSKAHLTTPASVKNYLFKALRNTVFRKLETAGRLTRIDEAADYDFTFEVSFDHQLIANEEERILQQKMKSVVQDLPYRQQEIIYLRFYEGLSYVEIADVMGLNINSTYKLFYKAISHLQQILKVPKMAILIMLISLITDLEIF